jgi:hypothetical protein
MVMVLVFSDSRFCGIHGLSVLYTLCLGEGDLIKL